MGGMVAVLSEQRLGNCTWGRWLQNGCNSEWVNTGKYLFNHEVYTNINQN